MAEPIRGQQVWGVQALLLATADALAARFGAATVRGELASFTRAASGHCYFTLKDDEGGAATLRCVMFRRAAGMLPFTPKEGQQVQVRGAVGIYEARGELQFIVESMSLAGAGALYEQFLRLKAKLEADGLFATERKRSLPSHPERLGIVTSLGAAALHDVVTTLKRRSPHVSVVVYPSLVQGADAPPALVAALETAGQRREVDAIMLVRGGGSLEDLWAFNDERVVRAVVASPLPVVAGVGHESDVTLVDLAADVRAATPTAAAEIAAPSRDALLADLQASRTRAQRAMVRRLENHAVRLDRAAMAASAPSRGLQSHHRRLADLSGRLGPSFLAARRQMAVSLDALARETLQAVRSRLVLMDARLGRVESRLSGLDPRRVLTRGYAWVTDEQGRPLLSVASVRPGDRLRAVLNDGEVQAQATLVKPLNPAKTKLGSQD